MAVAAVPGLEQAAVEAIAQLGLPVAIRAALDAARAGQAAGLVDALPIFRRWWPGFPR